MAALALAVAGLLAAAPAQAQTQGPAAVHVDPVRKVPLAQTAPVIGQLVAIRTGAVAARVSAPVESFLVEVGDRVDRGQTIALLDDEILAARRDQAAAALAEARARLTTRRESLKLAEQELARLERLKSSAAFSQAQYEDQRQEVAIARAELAGGRAAIATAQADLALAEINLDNAEIRAPYPGAVTERMVEVGAYVQVGEPLVRLVADAQLEVAADVPFQRLEGLTPGKAVEVTLEDGTRHAARVRAVLPRENPLTRTRTVRLVPAFADAHQPLASGQSATVHVPVGEARQVLSVHKDAVIRREAQAIVYVYADGKAEVRPVQLGTEVGARFEVLEGLAPGDLTVVRGNERLRPGDPLKIEKRLGPDDDDARQGS